jgi:hypothetical protein
MSKVGKARMDLISASVKVVSWRSKLVFM